MNKAQAGKKVAKKPVKKRTPHPNDDYKDMVDPATGKKGTMGGEGTTPPFTAEERRKMPKVGSMGSGKNGKTMSKAKNGKSFPDLNKDGKVTRADILKGRGVIAKNGKPVKKAAIGALLPLAMKAAPMVAGMFGGKGKKGGMGGIGGMLGGLLGKNGKSVKKAKSGTLVKKAQMGSFVTNEFAAKNRAFPASPKPKSTSNTKLLDSSIKKGKAINAYQGKKGMVAKSGTSMKKCKGGC
jgi:hypothetical protein